MKLLSSFLVWVALLLHCMASGQSKNASVQKGVYLQNISWTTAKTLLTPDAVVVFPMGAGAKEHGPHLPLATDLIQAEGTAKMLVQQRRVIIAPPINYGVYPAFVRYPGSTSIDFTSAVGMITDAIRTLAAQGPKRFYIINVGISTTPSLTAAAKLLADDGIALSFSTYTHPAVEAAANRFKAAPWGQHAHDIETASVLYLQPQLVHMEKAVNDTTLKGVRQQGILSPVEGENVTAVPSGVIGYAKLATKPMGENFMKAYTAEVVRQIDSLQQAPLPKAKDFSAAYKNYEGEYSAPGKVNLLFTVKSNHLWWRRADQQLFFPVPLHRQADDFFSAPNFSVLFVRDSAGAVSKIWVNRGEAFWMERVK